LTAEWWEGKYASQFEPPAPPPPETFSFKKAAKSKLLNAIRFPSKPIINQSPIPSTWKALTALSELNNLWILLKDHTSALEGKYDIEQTLILETVSTAFPKMREFTCFCNLTPLSYLRNFQDLRLLRFSG
jgi:hypothetical protein